MEQQNQDEESARTSRDILVSKDNGDASISLAWSMDSRYAGSGTTVDKVNVNTRTIQNNSSKSGPDIIDSSESKFEEIKARRQVPKRNNITSVVEHRHVHHPARNNEKLPAHSKYEPTTNNASKHKADGEPSSYDQKKLTKNSAYEHINNDQQQEVAAENNSRLQRTSAFYKKDKLINSKDLNSKILPQKSNNERIESLSKFIVGDAAARKSTLYENVQSKMPNEETVLASSSDTDDVFYDKRDVENNVDNADLPNLQVNNHNSVAVASSQFQLTYHILKSVEGAAEYEGGTKQPNSQPKELLRTNNRDSELGEDDRKIVKTSHSSLLSSSKDVLSSNQRITRTFDAGIQTGASLRNIAKRDKLSSTSSEQSQKQRKYRKYRRRKDLAKFLNNTNNGDKLMSKAGKVNHDQNDKPILKSNKEVNDQNNSPIIRSEKVVSNRANRPDLRSDEVIKDQNKRSIFRNEGHKNNLTYSQPVREGNTQLPLTRDNSQILLNRDNTQLPITGGNTQLPQQRFKNTIERYRQPTVFKDSSPKAYSMNQGPYCTVIQVTSDDSNDKFTGGRLDHFFSTEVFQTITYVSLLFLNMIIIGLLQSIR